MEEISLEQIDAFTDSFVRFGETTRKLHRAYRKLEERFYELNSRLEEANRRLRESLVERNRVSSYLNNILNNLNSGVLAIDRDGKITLFNKAAAQITGWPIQEAVGRFYSEVMCEENRNRHQPQEQNSALHTLSAGTPLQDKEKQLHTKYGTTIPVWFSTSLLTDGEGRVLGAVEVFRDLTEVKRLEEEVRRMHTLAALGQMAATVAHEVRNPLGGIAGFAALLKRDLKDNPQQRKLVEKIIEGVSSLNNIVTALLNYAKPVNRKSERINFLELMDRIVGFFEGSLNIRTAKADKKIVLKKSYQSDCIWCRADPEQLAEVALNLLQNAIDAMPQGGEVRVEVSTETDKNCSLQRFVILRVTDTGVGMTDDVKENLFMPFFTTKQNGTGLGLATAKKIIDAYNGDISVQSTPGKGSTFLVKLPCE
ncbi:MAG: PAS domain S-box protein [Candidatus Latescibacteria bacterium]|nr:PAS domain S-box protein [Candidatus Latescibacterota bacterium]